MELLKKYIPIFLFLVSFLWALRVLLFPNYPDFQVHYYGAQHLVQRENPYLLDSNYFTPQVYPPFDMVFFIPLSFFPYDFASKLWIVLSIASVLMSVYLINKVYKISFFSPLHLSLLALVFIAFPTKFTFGMGQINAVILLFTTLIWYYINKKDDIKTGLYFAFPVMLKFFPLLLGPYLLILRRWKALFILVISMALLFALSFIFVSLETHIYFFQILLPDLLSSWKGDYYNQSFTGVLMRGISDESLRQTLRMLIPPIVLVAIFGLILWNRKKSAEIINLEIALLVIVSLLINNFSWQHHFILLVLPFYVITYTILKYKRYYSLLIPLSLSYGLIAINLINPNNYHPLIQSHMFFGGIILLLVNIFLLIKDKK